MTNVIASWLAGLIFVALIADQVFNDGAAFVFTIVKLLEFIEWLAFWR